MTTPDNQPGIGRSEALRTQRLMERIYAYTAAALAPINDGNPEYDFTCRPYRPDPRMEIVPGFYSISFVLPSDPGDPGPIQVSLGRHLSGSSNPEPHYGARVARHFTASTRLINEDYGIDDKTIQENMQTLWSLYGATGGRRSQQPPTD